MNRDLVPEFELQTLRLRRGTTLAFRTAGDPQQTAIILMHGDVGSSWLFRKVMGPLAQVAFVVAPDFPSFGGSDPLPRASFEAFTDCVQELLVHLRVGRRFIYLHDYGSPVGLRLAMRAPGLVAGLIVQNGNAHPAGMGPQWAKTQAFWLAPNAENEAAATAHLTAEGVRNVYVSGAPADVAARIDPAGWTEDWRVMNLPGRMQNRRDLIADYATHVAQFVDIADYLKENQPPALLLWGRHDPYYELAEVWSWLEALPRLEAHILDGTHMLLETHAEEAARLMSHFIASTAQRE